MTPREIFAAGFWLASIVEVAGFTYEAFSNTYEQFDSPGSSGTTPQTPEAKQASKQSQQHSFGPFAGAVTFLENAVNVPAKLLGIPVPATGGVPSKEMKRLNSLKQPSQAMVNQLKQANRSGGPKLVTAANHFSGWALNNGWRQSDVTLFLRNIGVHVF